MKKYILFIYGSIFSSINYVGVILSDLYQLNNLSSFVLTNTLVFTVCFILYFSYSKIKFLKDINHFRINLIISFLGNMALLYMTLLKR